MTFVTLAQLIRDMNLEMVNQVAQEKYEKIQIKNQQY